MSIRVPGAGDAPMSGSMSAGDLLVRVNIASSKVWRRQGVHLYHDARVAAHTAMLGGRVRVPTLDGEVYVAVQAGTQPGDDVVLRGRGVAPLQGRSKGDLYISFMVEIPRSVHSLDLICVMADGKPSLCAVGRARGRVFIDRRSLTERQRKYLEMFAEDVEGRAGGQGTRSEAAGAASLSTESQEKRGEEREGESESSKEKPLGG